MCKQPSEVLPGYRVKESTVQGNFLNTLEDTPSRVAVARKGICYVLQVLEEILLAFGLVEATGQFIKIYKYVAVPRM